MTGRHVEVVGLRPLSHPRKARLAIEILLAYARVRWLLLRFDLPTALSALRSGFGPSPHGDAARLAPLTGIRLGHAVIRTLRVLPTDSRCLMRSLVLTSLLARRGIESSLIIGVRPGDELSAHAWLEYGETPLLPTGSDYGRLLEA